MSYILDALKRAERERSSAVPEQAGTAAMPAQRRLRPTTIALAGASLFLAGIGVAALLLRPSMPAPADAPMRAAEAPSPVVPTPTAPTPAPPAPAQPMLGDVAELTAYESLDDVSPVFQGSPTGPAAATGGSSPTPLATIAHTPETGVRTEAAATPRAGSTTPRQTDAARNLPPRLAEMPEDFQSRFPSPLIQVHVFDAEPSRRWIMVDNRRQGEGGVLDNGLRIAEILGDGVIFEFSGSRVYWPLNR